MSRGQNFRVQLGPLAEEIERRGLATFTYSQGAHEVEPPQGWEDYFGSRPLYRFLDTRQGDNFDNLRRIRYVPHSMNAEDAMRMFQSCGEGEDWHQHVWREALDGVMRTVDENPDVDAIIGYSEGAMVGASLVVEEAVQERKTGRPRRIKVRWVNEARWGGSGQSWMRRLTGSFCSLRFLYLGLRR